MTELGKKHSRQLADFQCYVIVGIWVPVTVDRLKWKQQTTASRASDLYCFLLVAVLVGFFLIYVLSRTASVTIFLYYAHWLKNINQSSNKK